MIHGLRSTLQEMRGSNSNVVTDRGGRDWKYGHGTEIYGIPKEKT